MGHMEGIYRCAREADWILGRWQAGQNDSIRAFAPHGILCQLHAGVPDLVNQVVDLHVPAVSLSTHLRHLHIPSVIPDEVMAGRMAAEHMLDRGFRQFVYMGVSYQFKTFGTGFTDTIAATGCTSTHVLLDTPAVTDITGEVFPGMKFIHDEYSKGRRHWARQFFTKIAKPVGVFITGEVWANDIVEACLDAGIHIPEEVAFVASAESPYECANLPVPFTTVLLDYEEQAYRAAAMLDRIMRGTRVAGDTVSLVPPKGVIERASTRVYVKDNLDVSRAVAFIMRELQNTQLSVKAVVNYLAKPPRTLYYEFCRHTGMTIGRYIEHLRLKEAMHLLASTELTASHIARRCGFSDMRHFCQALKRVTGKAPRAYRAALGTPDSDAVLPPNVRWGDCTGARHPAKAP